FRYLNKRKGQSTVEYAILIVVIIGALLAIQVYLKRGLQGRIKQAADDIGDQYSPGNANQMIVTKTYSKTNETFTKGASKKTLLDKEYTNRTTSGFAVLNQDMEYWGKKQTGEK
ncbi:MAG: hypothetical protein WC552_08460, partial [Candidatus Omnitrophota bacterium]